MVSETSLEQAFNNFSGFKDNQHPLYQGQDTLTQNSTGFGALGWGSFGANAYYCLLKSLITMMELCL